MTTFSTLLLRPSATQDGRVPVTASGLNKLRAGVLGANDGIVSVAAVTIGVAGAAPGRTAVLTAGLAALVGGALSMAVGEYVSVSAQRDAERSGFATSEPDELTNPWHAAISSLLAFLVGGIVPLLALFAPMAAIAPVAFGAVVVALVITGVVSARIGGADVPRAVARNVVGGALAMIVTYGLGRALHVVV